MYTRSASKKRRKLVKDDDEAAPTTIPTAIVATEATPTNPRTPDIMITAEQLRQVLEKDVNVTQPCQITYLTANQASWILLIPQWYPCPDDATFDAEWKLHPAQRHLLKIFGRVVAEKRWSQSWGVSYAYSGATNTARPILPDGRVAQLLHVVNEWICQCRRQWQPHQDNDNVGERPYNACLQNWYQPDDTIGRHADDERAMVPHLPIFSLSWGGTRRFVLRAKRNTTDKTEFYLQDGDLLVMGGTTQDTHYHEIPKRRVTMDPPTDRRINWTLRAFYAKK